MQVSDGNIALYKANPDGSKGYLIVGWNDDTIVKADLNTLTLTGGHGGTGNVETRGFCNLHTGMLSLHQNQARTQLIIISLTGIIGGIH